MSGIDSLFMPLYHLSLCWLVYRLLVVYTAHAPHMITCIHSVSIRGQMSARPPPIEFNFYESASTAGPQEDVMRRFAITRHQFQRVRHAGKEDVTHRKRRLSSAVGLRVSKPAGHGKRKETRGKQERNHPHSDNKSQIRFLYWGMLKICGKESQQEHGEHNIQHYIYRRFFLMMHSISFRERALML